MTDTMRETAALEAFEQYESRFRQAMEDAPRLRPWIPADRERIIAIVRKCLSIHDEYIPAIRARSVRTLAQKGFQIAFLQAESWPGVQAAAHLYVPEGGGRRPFVLLCCGHGAHCKLNPGYQAMARRLARQGAVVLVPDNIGQGERAPMGHRDSVTPFACGLSIQGLIVMETIAWLRWAMADARVDAGRMAAIGNSGGGTLTLFLGALCPELSALSSSGYPSSFEFIARKEKKHCHCNLLPGIVGNIEMWQALGLFAPRPLYLFQGVEDSLFPEDLFYSMARRVATVYRQAGAADRLRFETFPGPHPWNTARRYALGMFLSDALGIGPAEELSCDTDDCLPASYTCYERWPEGAYTLEELSRTLTGADPRPGLALWDVFPPLPGTDAYSHEGLRGDTRQVFAQYEAFLRR